MRSVVWLAALSVLLVASTATGQVNSPTADPAPAPPATAAPPTASPPPPAPPLPAPQPYGGYYLTPPPAYPQVNQNIFIYQSESKTPFVAIALEFFLPGVGSIYANDVRGALLTWGAFVGGIALVIWDLEQNGGLIDGNHNGNYSALYAGALMIVAGRVYGFVNAWTATNDYNDDLAARLGLRLVVAPIRTGSNLAWGPALSVTF